VSENPKEELYIRDDGVRNGSRSMCTDIGENAMPESGEKLSVRRLLVLGRSSPTKNLDVAKVVNEAGLGCEMSGSRYWHGRSSFTKNLDDAKVVNEAGLGCEMSGSRYWHGRSELASLW
jgi:hypothetical protein